MYNDSDRELYLQPEEQTEEYPLESMSEIDQTPPLSERLISWLETVDR
jgi:hypothetical protein